MLRENKSMSSLVDRFLRYIKIDTQSDPDSKSYPSTEKQKDLAKVLVTELKQLGVKDAEMDKYGYVTGTVPSNVKNKVPAIGFLAHMDTSPSSPGKNVNPQIIDSYDGSYSPWIGDRIIDHLGEMVRNLGGGIRDGKGDDM